MNAHLVLALVLVVPFATVSSSAAHEEDVRALREEIAALRSDVEALRMSLVDPSPGLSSIRLPEAISFAGTSVPLDRWDVAERLEREFFLALAERAQVILWLKRSARYFPYIEERLAAAGLPDDLKYVAVVESSLLPAAYSSAHASGIWQFIPDTGRRYGLRVAAAWDDRRDPERSTSAALAYLKDLHARFGDWPLALAAYNAGEGRVGGAMRSQRVSTYYQLALPTETERYVFRILAAKLILDEPARYGLGVPLEERYAPHATEVVTVPVTGSLPVQDLAAAAGSFYREIRVLNPAIVGDRLPEGSYDVRIPTGAETRLVAMLPRLKRAAATSDAPRVEYRVKRGDTLEGIARRFGVSVDALKSGNRTARRPHIYPGDRLIIERVGAPAR
ncbi:MAG: transglycosylase SLT domain-containing protein [Candidatus Rokubacteria bacterium]|nr:transglycosylase SLT domain-containing protein [Candidatus Rokubacteria bacterium]